jgi:hypothetical protein
MKPKPIIAAAIVLLLGVEMATAWARQRNHSDEGGHILALDNSWNRALETKDTKALDLLLADTFVSVDIDGSMETKRQFLAGIKAPDYHPSQVVTEHSTVLPYRRDLRPGPAPHSELWRRRIFLHIILVDNAVRCVQTSRPNKDGEPCS